MHDLNLLIAFDALVETTSVTTAAGLLHLSPSAMSRTLGRVRHAFDDPVLIRAGRVMVPTARALALHPQVRAVLKSAGDLLGPAIDVELSMVQRTFTIRGPEDVPAFLGRALVEALEREAPGVTLRFAPEGDEDTDELRLGRVDLDIGNHVGAEPDLCVEQLAEFRFVGVVDRNHTLATGRVSAKRLVQFPHVASSRRGRAWGPLDTALAEVGLTRRVVAVAPSPTAALAMVYGSDLVGIVPSLSVEQSGRLLSFPLPVATPTKQLTLTWHRRLDADPVHRWMRTLVAETFATQLAHVGGRSSTRSPT
jgi:DNA-binding transcriptional LysR family regulator